MWRALEERFIAAPRPGPIGLSLRFGLGELAELWSIKPFGTLAGLAARHFADARLQQLFGRYATYCGSSPYRAPATLALIAHLEARGVWRVDGGLSKLAEAVAALAARHGAVFRYGADAEAVETAHGRASGVRLASGEMLPADAVIANCDAAALADDRLGRAAARGVAPVARADRSLSALTWMIHGETQGFALDHHNVFFSSDYRREFDQIFRQRRLPAAPTVYVCAQDRGDAGRPPGPERLQLIVNAPPDGDTKPPTPEEIEQCRLATFSLMASCGLTVAPRSCVMAGPAEFAAMFPSTGGALYGRASHGWQASFRRQASRTGLAGLYCAGGSTHPGAGVPMATLSGRLAADALIADLASMRRSHRTAMPGGMSTPKATADAMA
jgi:1-hydroxycarotenoid 3,4-desaturase